MGIFNRHREQKAEENPATEARQAKGKYADQLHQIEMNPEVLSEGGQIELAHVSEAAANILKKDLGLEDYGGQGQAGEYFGRTVYGNATLFLKKDGAGYLFGITKRKDITELVENVPVAEDRTEDDPNAEAQQAKEKYFAKLNELRMNPEIMPEGQQIEVARVSEAAAKLLIDDLKLGDYSGQGQAGEYFGRVARGNITLYLKRLSTDEYILGVSSRKDVADQVRKVPYEKAA